MTRTTRAPPELSLANDNRNAKACLQRASGVGRLNLTRSGERTRVGRLYQQGVAKIRFPGPATSEEAEVVLINTAGGLTGGDVLAWELDAGPGCDVAVSTQACEKIYRSSGGAASVETCLTVAPGAVLSWLPQETILFDRSRLDRTLDVELGEGARLLAAEAVIFGRTARGEVFRSGSYRDRWRVRRNGALVHKEDARFDGDTGALLEEAAVLGGRTAMATLLLVCDDAADLLQLARRSLDDHENVVSGVSAWSAGETGKLLARMVAGDGYDLRKALISIIEVLSQRARVPKVWSI